ncbi:MAG: BtrH N-terminal domain-containing protein [bacterium]|nr:BtrH N-terminal domain-containing protein [bacterium]
MKEKIVIENFDTLGGNHCQTTALLHLLHHRGMEISEDMLLGLGGGIGFIYWYMKQMNAPFTGTRNGKVDEFILNITRRLGAEASIYQTSSKTKAYGKVKDILRAGDPAYIFVDMAYLPYLALPEEAHFGGHTVALFGIDETTDTAYIADCGKFPFKVPIENLNLAMGSKFPPFAAKNKILELTLPETPGMESIKKGVEDSITDCCNHMLNPPIKNLGLEGIKKWAKMVDKWPAQFNGMNLLECLFNVFIYLEIGGTGGRAFRPMYARFLREAARLVEKPDLENVADMLDVSAAAWGTIAESALPDSWPTLKRIKELTLEKGRAFGNEDTTSLDRLLELNKESSVAMQKAAEELEAARGKKLDELLKNLKQNILACHEKEEQAMRVLRTVMTK